MIRVFIEAVSGPGQGNRIPIGQNQVLTVGRTEWSDISIPNDPQISGKHFQVENTGAEVRIADLNSTNGTMVNGQFVKQAVLMPGDQIVAGSTTFVVHIERPVIPGGEPATWPTDQSLRVPNGGALTGSPAGIPTPSLHVPPAAAPPYPGPHVAPATNPPQPASPTPFAATGSPGFQSPIFIPPSSSIVVPTAPAAPLAPGPSAATPSPATPLVVPPSALPGTGPIPGSAATGNSAAAGGQTPFATPIQLDDRPGVVPREAAATIPRGAAPPPAQSEPTRPAVVIDERRQLASHDPATALGFRQTPYANGLVLYEGLPPADPTTPAATRVALTLAQIGPLELIVHFAKLGQPVPLDVRGKPLFHWLPEPAASQSGPLLLRPTPENAHLAWLDAGWGKDGVLAACGPDLEQLERHLLELIQFNPLGFRRGNTLFGYCWPAPLLQMCRAVQADVADALLGSAVHFYFCESDAIPGAWCLIGRPGLASTLQQLGFQEVPAAPSVRK